MSRRGGHLEEMPTADADRSDHAAKDLPPAERDTQLDNRRRHRAEILFCSLFVAVNLIVPMLCDDLYPFTSAPMFRDHPRQYCNYSVFAPEGNELPAADFLVQRVYDGNPPGVGVGIAPPPVLEQVFGTVADRRQVSQHVRKILSKRSDLSSVVVGQDVFGPSPTGQIERTAVHRWTVQRAGGAQ